MLKKGVRRRSFPPPVNISLPYNVPSGTLIKKRKENFFSDDTNSDMFCLADLNGLPYEVEDKPDWILSEFIQQIGLPLYTIVARCVGVSKVPPIL